MLTNEERIARMHGRVKELKRKRDKMITTALGCLSASMSFLLILTTAYFTGWTQVGRSHQTGGSLLLGQNAGGYVLVAVLAFFVGVLVTVIIRRIRGDEDPGVLQDSQDALSGMKEGGDKP